MKHLIERLTGSLYWRIAFIFLLNSVVLAACYLYITADTAEMYFQESSQRLNRTIAEHISHDTKPFINGVTNDEELKHVFHNVMVLNPSLELYLLDNQGSILSYFAPKSKVKLEKVSLEPIHRFIADTTESFIVGDDPRNPGLSKVFSAATVEENGQQLGYIYVVLASEEYASVTQMLLDNYRVRLAGQTMLVALIISFLISLGILWLLTRNLNKIIQAVRRFQRGDYSARIHLQSQGELSKVAQTFNSMAETTEKYINEIKSVEALRRELIANISHDLRTPLAAIQGYAETLVIKSRDLNEEDKLKYSRIILDGTERVKKLVQDLFELSKLETRQVEAHFEPFSLPELIQDVVQKFELMANNKQLTIETDIPRQLPFTYADIAMIDRVLQNLIENAIKHTPEKGQIRISLQRKDSLMEVVVADTGLGIPEDELPYIFERYRKGNHPKREGTGLGLAIVKKILELHRSSISVESTLNHGTQFAFNLPLATA